MILSVIVPVYNTSKYLKKCLTSLQSALSKTNDKIEVLIINDGSTDDSEEIILGFCSDTRFIYFKKENGGLSDVKNYGLKRAKGDYIIFLDSDDYIESDMYLKMLSVVNKEKADVVICNINLVFENGRNDELHPCYTSSRNTIFWQIVDIPMMAASWNKIIKKELYDNLPFPAGLNNEDIAVTPIVLGRANKISLCTDIAYNYLQRSDSIQNSVFSEKRFVVIDTAKLCMERMKELDIEKQLQIKGSVYLHQVLALALYNIRREKFSLRYKLLKKYMKIVEREFPDIWNVNEIYEFTTWGSPLLQLYRKLSIYLLKNKYYLLICIYFQITNLFFC